MGTTSKPGRGDTKTLARRGRQAGYLVAVAINAALVWIVNVTPGWRALSILSEDFTAVVGWLTASLVAGIAANLVYVAADPPWIRRLGDAATAALACVVLARLWSVFPFDLGQRWAGWETPLRVVLGFLTVATAIAVIANLARLVGILSGDDRS